MATGRDGGRTARVCLGLIGTGRTTSLGRRRAPLPRVALATRLASGILLIAIARTSPIAVATRTVGF